MGQFKLLLLKEKPTSLEDNELSSRKGPSSLEKHIFRIFMQSRFFFVCYKFATYHWKCLKEIYNFVIGNILIKIHMQKLWSNKILNTFVPQGTWLLPKAT